MYIKIQCGRQPASEEVVLILVSGACWCSDGELPATLMARAGSVVSQRGGEATLNTSSSPGVADHEGGPNFPVAQQSAICRLGWWWWWWS